MDLGGPGGCARPIGLLEFVASVGARTKGEIPMIGHLLCTAQCRVDLSQRAAIAGPDIGSESIVR